MKSEPVRVSTLIRPLNTAIPTKAERQDASALRSSDLASSVSEGMVASAGLVMSDRSAIEDFSSCDATTASGARLGCSCLGRSRHCLQIKNDNSTMSAHETKAP